MFGQQPYNVYQQPIYNQPPMPPMQEPQMQMRPQYQPAPQMQYPQQPQQNQAIIWVPRSRRMILLSHPTMRLPSGI